MCLRVYVGSFGSFVCLEGPQARAHVRIYEGRGASVRGGERWLCRSRLQRFCLAVPGDMAGKPSDVSGEMVRVQQNIKLMMTRGMCPYDHHTRMVLRKLVPPLGPKDPEEPGLMGKMLIFNDHIELLEHSLNAMCAVSHDAVYTSEFKDPFVACSCAMGV